MFLKTEVNIGEIVAGETEKIEFPYEGNLSIKRLASPCDCSIPTIDNGRRVVIIEFTPKFPAHFREDQINRYESNKHILVTYEEKLEDGLTEEKEIELHFTSTVKDNQ